MSAAIAPDQTRIVAEPCDAPLGAEVRNLDLSHELSDQQVHELGELVARHKVLFFRNQDMTSDQQLALGRRFGKLEIHPFASIEDTTDAIGLDRDHPELVVLESLPGKPAVAERWHSDTTWRECPSMGSILRMTIKPKGGGNTMWANMADAYEALDDETKARIDNAVAIHDWHPFEKRMRAKGVSEETMGKLRAEFPQVEHPLVTTHPQTGERILFVNPSFTVRIKGMSDQESSALLARLYEHTEKPEFRVTLVWEEGTVAFWDNRSTQHRVCSDVEGHRRMERVTIIGERPR